MSDYFDDPENMDWDQVEEMDEVSEHVTDWKINIVIARGRLWEEFEATGTYDDGELIKVEDIECTGGGDVDRND